MKNLLYLFLMTTLIMGGCEKQTIDDNNDKPLDKTSLSEVTTAQKLTSWDILRESFKQGENSLISPLSIQLALYMVYGAAEKETSEQMREVLNIQDIDNVHEIASSLVEQLKKDEEGRTLSISNACFYDPNRLAINQEYAQLLKKYYMEDVQQSDFRSPEAVDVINNWAKNATEGKIKKVIDRIKNDEILFLLNALYMKADWVHGFDEDLTKTGTFTRATGKEETAEFMFMDSKFRAFKNENISYLELPLADSSLRCTFIMPANNELTSQLNMLNPQKLNKYREIAERNRYQIRIPKLKIRYKSLINPWLKNLGMTEAFSEEKADFEKLGESIGNNYISRILHDTYFEMDEQGIEGAAVTTVSVGTTSLPPQITLNKPFILVVDDVETSVPIFAGIIQTTKSEG